MTRKLSRALWIMVVLPTVLTTAILLSAPRKAQSCTSTRCGCEFYYYSDASHTDLVGVRLYDCDCHLASWGIITIHREVFCDCC